jgi:hypothetical protein
MDDRTRFLLGKMVGLLGSDHDGEVLAAARQIRRLLESKGLSFGDLVALVEGKAKPVALGGGLVRMAEAILRNESMMREHESQFVRDVRLRLECTGGNWKMTEKQARWFSFLYARYGETS